MTPEDIKNIRYKMGYPDARSLSAPRWFHFTTVPKDIVERVFTALEQAWAERDALKVDADLCGKIIEEVVRRNGGSTPNWLIDMGPNVTEPLPTECLDPWEAGLLKVREALTNASNELHDIEWEASYQAIYKRLDQFIDAAAGTLMELIDARHGDQSGDYDAS